MSEPAKNADSRMLVQLSVDDLRAIVAEAIRAEAKALPKEDKLLTVEQVCEILNVEKEWIYHNAKKLPFVRKLGGMLRFSSNGLQRYIETRKFSAT